MEVPYIAKHPGLFFNRMPPNLHPKMADPWFAVYTSNEDGSKPDALRCTWCGNNIIRFSAVVNEYPLCIYFGVCSPEHADLFLEYTNSNEYVWKHYLEWLADLMLKTYPDTPDMV